MNKPYFAKLLPVEGHKGLSFHSSKFKVFLYSRDVKAGDMIHGEEGVIFNKPKLIVEDGMGGIEGGNWGHVSIFKNPYKIIGEILTPGIVDNQQFTEKEVEFLTIK